jgi:outer membrane protein OmpA-like peptidoglycan-associated protein
MWLRPSEERGATSSAVVVRAGTLRKKRKRVMKRSALVFVATPTILCIACASTTVPRELAYARATYDRVANGPAVELAPRALQVARNELSEAEDSFQWGGDTFMTRDLAYLATRQAQLADVTARTLQYNQRVNLAEHRVETTQAEQVASAKEQAASAEEQLAAERQRRLDAEKRADHALSQLSLIASVQKDTRGTVITIPGGVLFASASADLLPLAQVDLEKVADALAQTDPNSRIQVSGYTDSMGGKGYNVELSQRRADAVKDFLVSHGVSENRITAQGFGPEDPVASNRSAEGRADNRRVEIIVQPPARLAPALTVP